MTYKTHLSTGLLFSSIVFLSIYDLKLTPILTITLILSTIIGSSSPDLDTPTGGLWHKIPAGGVLSRIVNPIFIGGHRHLSHSLIGLSIFTGLYYLALKIIFSSTGLILNPYFLIPAFVIGFLSHLFADMFTEKGVPILFPWGYHFGIPPDPLGRLRIKTGRWFENLVIYPSINIALIIVIYLYFQTH